MELIQPFLTPLAGGLLIGLASALLLLGDGRIAGISGILGQGLFQGNADGSWRLYFIIGLILPAIAAAALGADMHPTPLSGNAPMLLIAGLLVGFGTRLGNGCTSGHGVCGISRLSARSIVATGTFMVVAALTVLVAKQF